MISFVKNVSILSDEELVSYSVKMVEHENKVGLHLVECLREAERRMLYAALNLSSLWEYATQVLKMSAGNAQQKIDAMRLSRDNPIAQKNIQSGDLSIKNAARLNQFFRQEKKAGNTYTPEKKAEVIQSVIGLSQKETERVLLTLAPEHIPDEKIRSLTDTKTELKIVVDEKTMAVLNRLRELLSHKMPAASYAELLDYLAREKVEQLEKKLMGATLEELKKAECEGEKLVTSQCEVSRSVDLTAQPNVLPQPTPRTYISVKDRRAVMKRAQGQCEHIGKDGHRCSSRWQIDVDHIVPLYLGGTNYISNLRAACRSHNLFFAKEKIEVMDDPSYYSRAGYLMLKENWKFTFNDGQ